MPTFDVGDVAIMRAKFRDPESKEPVDPTAVVFRVRKPDGTGVENTNADNPEVGEYVARIPVDQSGEWWWRADGTGEVEGSGETHFRVRARKVVEETP